MSQPRLVHVFPAFATGGPEVRTALLIDAMPDFDHTVVSLSGDDSGLQRLERPAAVAFRSLEGLGGLGNLRRLGRALRAERPDLLVTYGWGGTDAILGARAVGLPAPVHVEDGFLPDEARAQKSARLQVRRLAFRLAAALVVPSKTLESIATGSWWLPPDRVHYFPNGVDIDRFRPPVGDERAQARQGLGIADDELVVGTVAALRPDKNHERLVRVFGALSRRMPARLVIVGDGPSRPAIEREAHALGLSDRLILTGAARDPSALYRGFDVFALTSDTEQMPLSVLEAMASALPVVSTDVGDVRAMVPVNGGRVATLGDDQALEQHLLEAGADAGWRMRAGRRNRDYAEAEYSLARMIGAYRDVFRRHLAGSGAES